ncbi:MAG: VanZ family protein [Flavobacteriaceae bacterium]|nr:VanZ family protein [Flavobacteriaceae bacterium]
MQKRIKILLKGKIIFIALGITLLICYLSLKKLSSLQIQVSHIDKVFHAIAYFFLGISWLLSFPKSYSNKVVKYTILICCVLFGIIIEISQSTLTTYRTASLLDAIANTVGVVVAVIVFKSIYKKIIAI